MSRPVNIDGTWPTEQDEIEALHARIAELERDALRYRWLRLQSPSNEYHQIMNWVDGIDDWISWASPEDVDTAIDRAMRDGR